MSGQRDAPVQYCPLDRAKGENRLFHLHPGSDGDVISGSLECHELGSARESFDALSYVWGEIGDCTTIVVDETPVSVTKSLEAALRGLRFQDRPRTLWIDYICINQGDIEERNQQVANMGLLYEFAKSVLIWLGEETPDTAVGMKVLSYFANEPRPQLHPIWQHYPASVVQAGLLDIMNRAWFQRM